MSLVSRKELTVEWGDCDPAEITFYPNYFRWFDVGAHQLFRMAGIDWKEMAARYGVIGAPLIHAEASFRRPTRYGDTIVVESRVSEWSTKVFKVAHSVSQGGEVAVEGVETRGWIVRDEDGRLRTSPIPDHVRALFER
jgi:4-hydroxybenzoyl-CoA thioesterase